MISERTRRIRQQMPIHRERYPVDWSQSLIGHHHIPFGSMGLLPEGTPMTYPGHVTFFAGPAIPHPGITVTEASERYGIGL